MQKFTVFSILLSLVVVLTITDVLFSGYLTRKDLEQTQSMADPQTSLEIVEEQEALTLPTEDSPEEESAVELQEDRSGELPNDSASLPSTLNNEVFSGAGFEDPVLKTTPFSGLVFEFLGFSDAAQTSVYQWNLFEGSTYVGSLYELAYSTDIGGFQGYLNLRETAKSMSDLGNVNEVNNYGDSSFYFNHKVKTNTIHLLIRVGARLYAFEYGKNYHEKMKNVFDSLRSLQ